MKNLIYILIAASILSSCVSGRMFEDVKKEAMECATERDRLLNENDDLQTSLNELTIRADQMAKEVDVLRKDTTLLGSSYRIMSNQYDKINELNEQLLRKQGSLTSESESERKELLNSVLTLQKDLGEKQTVLDQLKNELDEKSKRLSEREARVQELESLIERSEKSSKELKAKISKALLSFSDKGLSVVEKNGRVYVSLDAKLLFASGSTKVGQEGIEALSKLAKAVQGQDDLSILVEGHTDTDKIIGNSAAFKDNWDLSVLRATSVVRIMLENSNIKPDMLTAAGRSEFLPVDPADKAKNRRIEVVLIPNLNELFEILEN